MLKLNDTLVDFDENFATTAASKTLLEHDDLFGIPKIGAATTYYLPCRPCDQAVCPTAVHEVGDENIARIGEHQLDTHSRVPWRHFLDGSHDAKETLRKLREQKMQATMPATETGEIFKRALPTHTPTTLL